MPTPPLSVDEAIATLKRSALPTLVTEGDDDYYFYRRIEEVLKSSGVSLMPVGGKQTVLSIFFRRKEIGRNNIMFLVDQDLWVFLGIPNDVRHRKILCSNGYSVENDLYADGELEHMFDASERRKFEQELKNLLEWYSFSVHKLLRFETSQIDVNPSRILTPTGALQKDYLNQIGFTGRSEHLYNEVLGNYARLLRGKTLLELAVRQLSRSDRRVKYSRHQLLEFGASRRGPNHQRLVEALRQFFPPRGSGT